MHRLSDGLEAPGFQKNKRKTILEKRGSPTKGDFIMTDIN